tara:strand:- start:293 stop:1465 length:1173 start_codon:yes stop_codon:yes gene_type:complete
MKKKISILGSTGSIGLSSIKIFKIKKKLFEYNVLAADKNYRIICKQIDLLKPNTFIINDIKVFKKIKEKYKNKKVKIIQLNEIDNYTFKNSDITIAAIPGIAGLKPTIKLIKKSKKILIANKESVICGWNLIKKAAIKNKTKIIPIDSEHFSIMKLLENQKMKEIKKIYLTASGGPFLNFTSTQLKNVKPNQALKHPKWKMGRKISIDSASLMNKLLEVIEAQKLFSIGANKIKIIIHPESLVHAVVELKNGLYKFIYHKTTMLIPLANAIFNDDVDITSILKPKLNNKKIFFDSLNFKEVDKKKFPIIKLKSRINEYNSTPIIINAVNEILVDQYLKKKIAFNSFYKLISYVLKDRNYKKYAIKVPKNVNQVLLIDQWSRKTTYEKIKK